MAFIKKITQEYGVISLMMAGLILTIMGLILNFVFSLPFTLLGLVVPALAPIVGVLSLALSLWVSAVIAIFVVLSFSTKKKYKKIGGF